MKKTKLNSFDLNTKTGEIKVNGVAMQNVSEFSLKYQNGKYSLCITTDQFFESKRPRNTRTMIS